MPVDSEGRWSPGLFPKQEEARAACQPSKRNLVLFSGPRYSSKTVCGLHCIAQHAWDTDRGNIALVSLTQSVGLDSGIWTDLTETVLPDWIAGNFGMEWVRKPYVQHVTKKPACSVSNKFGNQTKFQLDSLKNEDEVEDRYKGKRYSCIFVNELSKFAKRKTFDTLKQCLRMLHLKEEEHLFLADTNPSEEGSASWIYKLWYELLNNEHCPPDQIPLRDSLRLIEFIIDDNLACSPEKKAGLMADFAHDDDLVARYFYGKWVTATVDALFYKVFRPLFHVVGEEFGPNNPEPDIMVPEPDCFELYTSWDPGGINCATVIGEKCFPARHKGFPLFKILDEIVITGEDVDMEAFVSKVQERMKFWGNQVGKVLKWTHWSDRSVFDMKDLQSQKYYHQIIYELSGGKIDLLAAERGSGSVRMGVDLVRRLLWEERLFVNLAFCPNLIQMFKSIKKGKSELAVIAKGSRYKHVLDALRYFVQSECADELNRMIMLNIRNAKKANNAQGTLVTVPI